MAKRTLPGLNLTAYWPLGFDGWKDENDENLRKLSAFCQLRAESKTTDITAIGASSGGNDVYLVPDGAMAHENEIAIMDNAQWVYYTPEIGFLAYVMDEQAFYYYDENMQWSVLNTGGSGGASGASGGDSGGGGGATTLNELTDVDTSSSPPSTYDGLMWNGSLWVPTSVPGAVIPTTTINNAAHTAILTDLGKICRMNSSTARDYTVPPNASVAFPTNGILNVRQVGTGQVTIVAGSGVTINAPEGYSLRIAGQYSNVMLQKVDTNTWEIDGALEPLSS